MMKKLTLLNVEFVIMFFVDVDNKVREHSHHQKL